MFIKSLFLCFLSIFILVSCAIPSQSPNTARTLGNGNWQFQAGGGALIDMETGVDMTTDGTVVSKNEKYTEERGWLLIARGFGENFDGALTFEYSGNLIFGLRGKYAFINNDEGFSLAGYSEIFSSDVSGVHFGPILSYKTNLLEPYLGVSYRILTSAGKEACSENFSQETGFSRFIGDIVRRAQCRNLSYMQAVLGFNFWVNENAAINVHTNYLKVIGERGSYIFAPGVGLALGF